MLVLGDAFIFRQSFFQSILFSLPVRKTGIETKNPVMAHVRVMDASFRYLMVLKNKIIHVRTITIY